MNSVLSCTCINLTSLTSIKRSKMALMITRNNGEHVFTIIFDCPAHFWYFHIFIAGPHIRSQNKAEYRHTHPDVKVFTGFSLFSIELNIYSTSFSLLSNHLLIISHLQDEKSTPLKSMHDNCRNPSYKISSLFILYYPLTLSFPDHHLRNGYRFAGCQYLRYNSAKTAVRS